MQTKGFTFTIIEFSGYTQLDILMHMLDEKIGQ